MFYCLYFLHPPQTVKITLLRMTVNPFAKLCKFTLVV